MVSRVEDAVQDVFLDCFREGGALGRADPARPGGFRAFLYGITRVVALRHERAAARDVRRAVAGTGAALDDVAAEDPGLSTAFDKAWATALVRQAASLQRERAERAGDGALRRIELLRLRFEDALPIREIAMRWGEDAARLHHEYARARQEFKSALLDVVADHNPGSPEEVEAECRRLLGILG
jgi:RNA polymerase sigma-70 factor (ECF subfamily)